MNPPTKSLEAFVATTSDLPTMPAAALKVIQETDSPTATARSVSSYLAQDQALATRVLRLANSAYYGLARQVSDIHEAVIVLGLRAIRNLAVVASSYPWMSKAYPGYGLGPMQLWRHAFGTAVAAQIVAKRRGIRDTDTIFTAGLIHNLGKAVLSLRLEGHSKEVLLAAHEEHLTFSEIEKQFFGFDHAEVGAYLGEQWNLPASLAAGMRFHHQPDEATEHQDIVDCIHIGDNLTFAMDLGLEEDGMFHQFNPAALERSGIDPEGYEELVVACLEHYAELQQIYGFESDGRKAA